MKLLFENTTKHSKKSYDKFLKFHKDTFGFKYLIYTVAVSAAIILGIALQLSYHNFSLAILICFILTFFILWRLLHPASEISKEYKSDKVKNEKEHCFKFYESFFTVDDRKDIYEIRYFKLYKVFEVPDFFYLYIDKNHAFLIDKSKFKSNNPEKFSEFIKQKCFLKYKFKNDRS